MRKLTERHCGKAVIKDKSLLPEAMEKLAVVEETEKIKCNGCKYEYCTKQLYPCRVCKRNVKDLYKKKEE